MGDTDEVRDDAEIKSKRNWFAQFAVGILVMAGLGLGVRFVWISIDRDSAAPGAAAAGSAPDVTTPLDGPDHAERDNTAAAGLADPEPVLRLEASPLITQEIDPDLDLGLDAVVGWSSYGRDTSLVDLSTGIVSSIVGHKLLAITDTYLLVTDAEVDPTDDVEAPLTVIDRSDGTTSELQSVVGDVVYAVRGAGGNDVWVTNVNASGFTHRQVNLVEDRVLAEIAETTALIRERPGQEPYATHQAAGSFEIVDGQLAFLDRGHLVATNRTSELWATCSDSMQCTTMKRSAEGDVVLDIDLPRGLWWLEDTAARLSPDGRFVVTVDSWSGGGTTVHDTLTGESTSFDELQAWSAAQIRFVDGVLIGPGSGALILIDPASGQTTRVQLASGFIDERLITGPRYEG